VADKVSSPGNAAKAVSPSISSNVGLPKAQVLSVDNEPQAKPAAKGPQAVRVISLSEADAAPHDPDNAATEPADDSLGFLAKESARPRRGAAPVVVVTAGKQPSDESSPIDDIASIAGPAARSSRATLPSRSKKKKQGVPTWLVVSIAAVVVGGIVGIGAMLYMADSKANPSNRSTAGPSTANNGGPTKSDRETRKVPLFTIDWPIEQRVSASLSVNGEKREVPSAGPIEIPLPPSTEQYKFTLERPGFKPKTFYRAAANDEAPLPYDASEWEAVESKSIAWPQDFEEAKKTASNEHKNVMILFDASDDKESSFRSSHFKDAIAKQEEFHKRAEKEYVCVYIDNPKNAEAQAEVKDTSRNSKLTEKFGVNVFPSVVVTDAKGRPFGVLDGYDSTGITTFLKLMNKWSADGKRLFALLAKLDAVSKDKPDPELASDVLDFLDLSNLARFYKHTVNKAMACLPNGERPPVTKEAADVWMRRLMVAARNPEDAKKEVEKFDGWKQKRTFKDREMAAVIHLVIAGMLARLDLRKEAAEKCKEGLAFQPHNPGVKAYLEQFSRYLSVEPGKPFLIPVGSGTGYCIAQGNYLLTNHHVIRKAKEIKVRLNNETDMHAAKLIADDDSGDMAILKVDLPAGKKLVPIPLMANELKIGEDVCTLGWPGVMSQNITLTLTKGVVSTLPPPDDNEAFIVTDCTVNPGNSGGPLCSFCGGVAGMVTRKSQITSHESSYGMAIPVGRISKFLKDKLPRDAPMPTALGAKPASMKLAELAEKIAPSVVYIENIQEVRPPRKEGPGQEEPESELDPGE